MTKYALIDHISPVTPKPVIGWYDDKEFHHGAVAKCPKESLRICPDDVWELRCTSGWAVTDNGTFVKVAAFTPITRSLVDQANTEVTWCHTQATLALAKKQHFTDVMIQYTTLVENIASGKDVTTKELPSRPTTISE